MSINRLTERLAPKGASFNSTLTSQAPNTGLGMQQHKKSAKSGNRHGGPLESLNPGHGTFHKL